MEFNQLVLERLEPLLKEHNFQIAASYKNFIRFKSNIVEITVSYNELDKSSLIEIGKRDDSLYPINDSIIKQIFNSDIKISQVLKEVFVNNLVYFFNHEGATILKGDLEKLQTVKNVVYKESEAYMSQLLEKQALEGATTAWNNGDYKEFIRLIDKLDKESLAPSYQLKYKIAMQKL